MDPHKARYIRDGLVLWSPFLWIFVFSLYVADRIPASIIIAYTVIYIVLITYWTIKYSLKGDTYLREPKYSGRTRFYTETKPDKTYVITHSDNTETVIKEYDGDR